MQKQIIVVLETASHAGRAQLIGILRRINDERTGWKLQIVSTRKDLAAGQLDRLLAAGADAAIVAVPQDGDVPPALKTSKIPLVLMDVTAENALPPSGRTVCVRINDRDIGLAAERHFAALGDFRSYVFVNDPRLEVWSTERANAFAAAVRSRGKACYVYSPPATASVAVRATKTARLLQSLPAPVAVLLANDQLAPEVYRACRIAGLHIPDDASVLGIDNDESICCRMTPTLSSIRPDFEEEGFRAAGELLRLFRYPSCSDSRLAPSVDLIERNSTHPTPPAARLVESALKFIEKNFTRPITVSDVTRHLGVSRRLADLRFRQMQKETILKCITARRLRELKRQLSRSPLPLHVLAGACGFGSCVQAAHLFKAAYGMSMSQFRNRKAETPPKPAGTAGEGAKRQDAPPA